MLREDAATELERTGRVCHAMQTPEELAGCDDIHPSVRGLLRFFAWGHLPPKLAAISAPFGELAANLAVTIEGPEATVALRKLLEAKDCAVRAALEPSS